MKNALSLTFHRKAIKTVTFIKYVSICQKVYTYCLKYQILCINRFWNLDYDVKLSLSSDKILLVSLDVFKDLTGHSLVYWEDNNWFVEIILYLSPPASSFYTENTAFPYAWTLALHGKYTLLTVLNSTILY